MTRYSHGGAIALLLLGSVQPLAATTFVLGSDADLRAGADVVALGRVQSIASAATGEHGIETEVRVRVLQRYVGAAPDDIIIRLPGGDLGNVRRVVFGLPSFRSGERYLLFLSARPDGRYDPTDLAMGVFRLTALPNGEAVAVRNIGGSRVLGWRSGRLQRRPPGEVRRLSSLLRSVGSDRPYQPSDAAFDVPEMPAPNRFRADFTYLYGEPARWFEPDRKQPIVYDVDEANAAATGLDALGGVAAALAAWSNVDCAGVRLRRGAAAPAASFDECDGRSLIGFEDPFAELKPFRDCSGVVGAGAFCSVPDGGTIGGVNYRRITEGDVLLNRGLADCPKWSPVGLAESLTHEIGHTLGLGHSSEKRIEADPLLADAAMYYRTHLDGRGASIREDDRVGICSIYPPAPFVDSDGDGIEDVLDDCPSDADRQQIDSDGDGVGDACDPLTLRSMIHAGGRVLLRATIRPSPRFDPLQTTLVIRLLSGSRTVLLARSVGDCALDAKGVALRCRRVTDSSTETLLLIRKGAAYRLRYRARLSVPNSSLASADKVTVSIGDEAFENPLPR